MSRPMFADAERKPQLFRWNGQIDTEQLVTWIRRHDWTVPSDLLEFWVATGGGEVFETETFLKPLVSGDHEDGVEHVTNWRHVIGMPAGLIVFHKGLSYTAVRCQDGAYVSFDGDDRTAQVYGSFDEWYIQVLRAEYAERYGLTAV